MIRLALLPPREPDRWWRALAEGLAGRHGVDALWVADEPAGDPRLGWLPVTAPPADRAAPAVAPSPAAASGAALVVDVHAPRADVVTAMAAELPVLAVASAPVDDAAAQLASCAHRLLVPSAALARMLPAGLSWRVVAAPLDALDLTEPGDRSPAAAPTVVVLGAPLSEQVRLAWSPITRRWPDAVLVGDLDGLPAAARATVLADAHVAVVLDAGGAALAEALASGATVVAHAEPAAAAVLTHGGDALLTDARSPEQLAGTLAYALDYHEQLAAVRRAGRVLARERFSTATLAERVLAELAAVLGRSVAGVAPAPAAAGTGAGAGGSDAIGAPTDGRHDGRATGVQPPEAALTPTRSAI